MAHKASLLLQATLGCVDLSDVPEPARRQIALDTTLLLERMHRLVRAIVECKASDLDGVTCRVALDLARSMAARAWEGKSMQLTQVSQLGPVFMRKFVASGITTVHDLANACASNIERILSRNPPFGKKMADELAHFPRLTLEARIATETPRALDSDRQPVARIDAILGFSNTIGKPKWRGKIPSVTFMAETTDGVLAHWWRGSIKRFKEEENHKMSLQFEVGLNSVTEEVVCYFACEDIVGTLVTKRLEHGLPASAFPSRKRSTSQLSQTSGKSAASLMDDDIGDNDLWDITKEGQDHSEECLVISEDSDAESQWHMVDRDGKSHVDGHQKQNDDIAPSQDSEQENIPWQPIQLPNGKFKCNHHCADAGLKNGKGRACAHRCCREGLDVPRKPKPSNSKRKAGLEEVVVAGPASQLTSEPSTKRAKTTQTGGMASKAPLRESLAFVPAKRQDHPLIDLDDLDLDGDGLFDLTQIGGTHVDDLQSSGRSQFKIGKPASRKGLHDKEDDFVDSLFHNATQDDLASPMGGRGSDRDDGFEASKRMSSLHAGLSKTQSNSTDNFSGDSVFDGVDVDECDGQPPRSHNALVGTTSASRRPRNSGDVFMHKVSRIESSREDSPSDISLTMSKHLDQLGAKSRLDERSRADVVFPPANYSGMRSTVAETRLTSQVIPSTMRDVSLRQGSAMETEAKQSEDETYIFSDNYVLPPPRDSFGEGSVVLPHVSNDGHLQHQTDARAFRKPEKPGCTSSENKVPQANLQDDPDWQEFERAFTDEFRDLVEFI